VILVFSLEIGDVAPSHTLTLQLVPQPPPVEGNHFSRADSFGSLFFAIRMDPTFRSFFPRCSGPVGSSFNVLMTQIRCFLWSPPRDVLNVHRIHESFSTSLFLLVFEFLPGRPSLTGPHPAHCLRKDLFPLSLGQAHFTVLLHLPPPFF